MRDRGFPRRRPPEPCVCTTNVFSYPRLSRVNLRCGRTTSSFGFALQSYAPVFSNGTAKLAGPRISRVAARLHVTGRQVEVPFEPAHAVARQPVRHGAPS